MMYALIGADSYYRHDVFPCALKRTERVLAISTQKEIKRLQTLLCVAPLAGETNLYLMKDTRTGFTKIGIAKNPKYRERTLQSDYPLIELTHVWEADKRHERIFHKRYKSLCVRGEWYRLEDHHIKEIDMYMSAEYARQFKYELEHKALKAMNVRAQAIADSLDISTLTGNRIAIDYSVCD